MLMTSTNMQLQLATQMLEPRGMSLRHILTKFIFVSVFLMINFVESETASSIRFSEQKSGIIRSGFYIKTSLFVLTRKVKGKGKGRLWVLQHCCLEAYCTLTRMSSFIHLQRRCTHQAA